MKPHGSHPAGFRAIGNASLCLLCFLIAALALHLLVPWEPLIPSYTERLRFYRDHADRFSMVFIGSSRVRAHVNPRTFDASLGREGYRHRSFNIGVDALSLIELKSIVDQIVRLRPPSLRFALIEPVFSTNLPWDNVATERSIYFHDLENTALEIECNLTLPRMRSTTGRSLLAAGYHLANLGRLSAFVAPPGAARGVHSVLVPLSRLRADRGFQAQDTLATQGLLKWRRKFLRNLDDLSVIMREGRTLEGGKRFDMPCHFEAVLQMARDLRKAGVEPIFVNTPAFLWIYASLSFEEYAREAGDPTPMLSYIRGHDDLYEPALWYDHRHLTGEGAGMFSRRLARDMAGLLSSDSGL